MNSSGMNTAISETVSEITVKPISRAPRNAASSGASPSSMWRTMFSIITMASSTTKPVPMVSAISDRLSSEKPQNHITPKVAMSESGKRDPGDDGGADGAQEDQHHQHHQRDAEDERELHVVDRGADGLGAVAHDGELDVTRHCAFEARHFGMHTAHGFDDIGAGLALDVDDDRRHALVPAADLVVLQSVDDVGDVAQHHRRAVACR